MRQALSCGGLATLHQNCNRDTQSYRKAVKNNSKKSASCGGLVMWCQRDGQHMIGFEQETVRSSIC
jgi:hypothetical protein